MRFRLLDVPDLATHYSRGRVRKYLRIGQGPVYSLHIGRAFGLDRIFVGNRKNDVTQGLFERRIIHLDSRALLSVFWDNGFAKGDLIAFRRT